MRVVPSIFLSVSLFLSLSLCLFIYLFIYLSISLSRINRVSRPVLSFESLFLFFFVRQKFAVRDDFYLEKDVNSN